MLDLVHLDHAIALDGTLPTAHAQLTIGAVVESVDDTDYGRVVTVDVTIPYDRGELVARIHQAGRVDAIEHTEGGTRIKAQVPVAVAAGLREFTTV